MACEECHFIREDGSFNGLPNTASCAACHEEAVSESAEEKRFIDEYVKKGREIRNEWLVYQKQPDNVFFSHAVHSLERCANCHTEFETTQQFCNICHLDVASTTTPPVYKENRISTYSVNTMKMPECEACHANPGHYGTTNASGNKDNAYSAGGLTPLAASEAQLLYAESRIKRPLKRGADGGYAYTSWEDAESILKEKTRNAQGSLAFLTSDSSSSLNDIFSDFTAENGSRDFFFMPSDEQAAAVAWNTVGGSGSLGYDIANSDCILAVGANFMDSWGTVAHNRAVFKETHPTGENAEQAIYYAGAMQNNTAVVADSWLPVKPGTEEIFLGAVLSELIKNNIMASRYSIEEAGKACGTDTEQIKKLVSALKNANRPLVFAGTTEGQSLGSTVHMLAIAINAVLGRINQDGGMVALPEREPLLPSAQRYSDDKCAKTAFYQ